MASTLIAPIRRTKGKGKNMATSNVVPQQIDPGIYKNQVRKNVDNPFTGKKVEMTGTYQLPIAQNLNEINSMTKGDEQEITFWFNYGRKVAAKNQALAALDFGLETEDLNDLHSQFKNALRNMVDETTPDDRRKVVIDFILGVPKYQKLKTALDELQKTGMEPIALDFGGKDELRKPTGVRGRRKKSADSPDSVDSADTDDTDDSADAGE